MRNRSLPTLMSMPLRMRVACIDDAIFSLYILAIVAHIVEPGQPCYDAKRGVYAVGSAALSARAARTDLSPGRHRRSRLDPAGRPVRNTHRLRAYRRTARALPRSN